MIEGLPAAGKAAVVVLGGPHSGAAVLSRCLEILGLVAAREDGTAGPGAAEATGSANPIAGVNERILTDLGAAWDRPAVFITGGKPPRESAGEFDALITKRYLADAAETLRAVYGEARRIVVDEPRIALFPGLWDAALRANGFTSHRVLVVRNPIEAVEWLFMHRKLGRPRGLQLWLRDTVCALAAPAARPEIVLRLDTLRQRRAAALLDMLGELRIGGLDAGAAGDAVEKVLADSLRDEPLPPEYLYRRPLISALVKDTYRVCLEWAECSPQERQDAAADLAARFEEFCLTASAFAHVPAAALAPAVARESAAPQPAGAVGRRSVIIHYHLFKNAGTSVDAILKRNFGALWTAQEYDGRAPRETVEAACDFLLAHPEIRALSSHTLQLPPPEIPGLEIFPILFLRHPLDRLKSAYTFERIQQADTDGARLAKETDFAGYIRARLANERDRVCRNFHTVRLAIGEADGGSELERALRVFERLPFVGSVERFRESIEALQRLLAPRFPGFEAFAAFENVSRPERDLDTRIAKIRDELGDELYEMLVAANQDDFVLYRRALERHGGETPIASVEAGSSRRRPAIPRTVFAFWHDTDIPEDVASAIDSWRTVGGLPVEIYSDNTARQFIAAHCGTAVVRLYDMCNLPAMRSDYFRLCRALHGGGLYVDAAMKCLAPLEPFFDDDHDLICVRWSHGRIVNRIFSSPAGSPVVQQIFDRVSTNIQTRSSNNLWEVTGAAAWIPVVDGDSGKQGSKVKVIDSGDLVSKYLLPYAIASSGRGTARHWSEVQKTTPIFRDTEAAE